MSIDVTLPIEKRCAGCNQTKPSCEFNKSKRGRLGLHNHCRECQRTVRHNWYLKNRAAELIKASEYGRTEFCKMSRRERYITHREDLLEYNRRRRATPRARALANKARNKLYNENINFKLSVTLRNRLRSAIKGAKWASAQAMLGCSIEELKQYLEERFQPGMSWDNYTYSGWHIDHIRPCASFDLSDPEQQKICFHFTNLGPLWKIDNQRKGSSFTAATP